MKVIKLERMKFGIHPIVRVTYKTKFGRTKVGDTMNHLGTWKFIDSGLWLSSHSYFIDNFIDNNLDIYVINEQTFIPPPRQLPRIIKEDKC